MLESGPTQLLPLTAAPDTQQAAAGGSGECYLYLLTGYNLPVALQLLEAGLFASIQFNVNLRHQTIIIKLCGAV